MARSISVSCAKTMLLCLLAFTVQIKTVTQEIATYAGRPFVQIAHSYYPDDPITGSISSFDSAQLVGNQVVFIPEAALTPSGVFSGRGGPIAKIVGVGEVLSGVAFTEINPGFERDSGSGEIAISSLDSQGSSVHLINSTNVTTLVASGTILPHSQGQTANLLGAPYLARGNVALIATHSLGPGAGISFQGVYRILNQSLEPVADTVTALPELGVPSVFSGTIGFDGETLAFWASKRPMSQDDAIFLQAPGAAVVKIAETGERLPEEGIISSLGAQPFVSEGIVYFFASDEISKTSLLKYEKGALTTLARDGDITPYGNLQFIGDSGLVVENGKIFFPAYTRNGAGVFSIENGALHTIIAPRSRVGGFTPSDILLKDVSGDTLVLELIVGNGGNRSLVANLTEPAIPVILTNLSSRMVKPGTRVELHVGALGDAPLQCAWSKDGQVIPGQSADSLVIEAAGALDVANYQVNVSNPYGSIYSSNALLNVEIAPTIVNPPTSLEVEEGDPILLGVTTAGGLPQSFYWQKDGEAAVNETPWLNTFYRTAAGQSDAGQYRVIVSNAWGQVTTTESTVTIKAAAPNPIYAGRKFVKVLDDKTVAPGTDSKFDTLTLSEAAVRWAGSRIIFTGESAGQASLGVFSWDNGSMTRLLAPSAELPNALGTSGGYQLVKTLPDDPIIIRATQLVNGVQKAVGIYRINEGKLDVLVDATMNVPESSLAFPSFAGEASYARNRLVIDETIDYMPSLFLWNDGNLNTILRADQDLPLLGTLTEYLQSLSYNGTNCLINALTIGGRQSVILQLNMSGEITKVIANGEPLPGTSRIITSFAGVGTDGTNYYLNIYDNTRSYNIYSYANGVFSCLLAPGMELPTLGTIKLIQDSQPHGSDGKAYASAQVLTASLLLQGIISGDGTRVEPVLFATKLDARRVKALSVCDVHEDRLIVLAQFEDGTRAYYANVGVVEEDLQLTFTRSGPNTILFTVPENAMLESANEPDSDDWIMVPSPEVTIGPGQRFFRLRNKASAYSDDNP